MSSTNPERPSADVDAAARSRYVRIGFIIVVLAAFGVLSAVRTHSWLDAGAAALMLGGATCTWLADRARVDVIAKEHLPSYGVEAAWLVAGAALAGVGLYLLAH